VTEKQQEFYGEASRQMMVQRPRPMYAIQYVKSKKQKMWQQSMPDVRPTYAMLKKKGWQCERLGPAKAVQ